MASKRTILLVGLALVTCITAATLVWSPLLAAPQTKTERKGFSTLPGLYEPSGVAQLPDGRVLVVEDEPSHPFSILTYQTSSKDFSLEALHPASLLDRLITRFDDLEGVTVDSAGTIYAITSHARKANGKRSNEREQLIRFKVTDKNHSAVEVRTDLRKRLTKNFSALENAAKEHNPEKSLNIEGMTLSKTQESLWIALRSPLIKKHAVLVKLLEPASTFDEDKKIVFEEHLTLLDLDRGGIRDITFDPQLGGYLVLSQQESTKKEKPFKLWFWTGDPKHKPQRIRITGVKNLRRAEAVAPVLIKGKRKLLLLSDDGLRLKGQSAKYALLDYDQLEIDPTR